ncbi:cryptochrome/photolyase family protein [Rubrivirga sp. IMCC45206]|uniref:cryptochrome/photolyase family protein n=1 Tax=Rubrivirga sp. IMCC45206 TaxID=3391614 RepID=UPI00398FC9CE
MPTTVVWLRNSLRLADHPALAHAAERGAVVPVFVWAPDEEAPWAPEGAHQWWLDGSLRALDGDLRNKASRLTIRHGASLDELKAICQATGADRVVWQTRMAPTLRKRDEAVREGLEAAGIEVRTFAGRILHDPEQVQTGSDGPYHVFGPFWRRFKEEVAIGEPLAVPDLGASRAPETWPETLAVDALGLSDLAQDGVAWAGGMAEEWTPGEAGAQARLDTFLDEALVDYPEGRNVPAARDTSMLSPHLHWGEISPRDVWARVQAWVQNGAMRQDADKFLSEVGWREFSYHVLHHYPTMPSEPLKDKYAGFPWRDAPEDFAAWKAGRTGYPFVDAGMRQLWAQGWMHNRLRMVTASFLTKHLLIRWQDGARYFWDTLCGGDLANNSMGWQWAAGSGADAQPFFRIFNPITQGEKHDPDGAYIRRWVPELADLPDAHLHAPWDAPADVLAEAGVTLGETYPHPIVDHAEARERALDALKTVNG